MNQRRVYDLAVQVAVAAIAANIPAGSTLRMRVQDAWSWDHFEMTAVGHDYGNEKIFYAYLNGDPVIYARVYRPWR